MRAKRFQFSLFTAILAMFFAAIVMHGVIHDPGLALGFAISSAAACGLYKLGTWFDFELLSAVRLVAVHSIFFWMTFSALLSVFYFCAITSQIVVRF